MRTLPNDLPSLPDGWSYQVLGELLADRGISYGVVQPGQRVSDGVPMIRVNNIKDGKIREDDIFRVDEAIECGYLRTRLLGGEVLLTLVGSLGECAVVPERLSGWNIARAVGMIPVRSDVSPEWVAYCLRSSILQRYMRDWATTTVQATLNLRDVAKLPVPLPPRTEREAIVSIVKALDDKIDLNRRLNQALEAIARAIFKSWFVDRGPMREGRPGFSGAPKESQVETIPDGWAVESVYRVANVLYGAPFSSSLFNEIGVGLPLMRIRDLVSQEPNVFTAERHPKGFTAKPGDLVVGMDGEFRIHLWRGPESLVNQRICLFRPKIGIPRAFVRYSLEKPLEFFERSKSGTTVIHLGKADIDTFRIVVPDQGALDAFSEVTEPLFDHILANEAESRTLAALRDTLLPKLLSGEIRVKQAEKVVGESV